MCYAAAQLHHCRLMNQREPPGVAARPDGVFAARRRGPLSSSARGHAIAQQIPGTFPAAHRQTDWSHLERTAASAILCLTACGQGRMLTGRGGHGRPAENRVRLLPLARPAANVSLRDGNASEAIWTWRARTFVSLALSKLCFKPFFVIKNESIEDENDNGTAHE